MKLFGVKRIIATVAMLLCSMPAMAFNVKMDGLNLDLYGQVRINMYYDMQDNDLPGSQHAEVNKFNNTMLGNSRIGFKFSYDKMFGNMETNYVPNPGTGTFGFRQLWVGYKHNDALSVKVGQQPAINMNFQLFSDIYNNGIGLSGYGTHGGYRAPQIQITYNKFTLSLSDVGSASALLTMTGATMDANYNDIPRIEALYLGKAGKVNYRVFGGYSYRVFDATGTNTAGKYSVNSMNIGTHGDIKFGDVIVKAGAYWGMNDTEGNGSRTLNSTTTGVALNTTALQPVLVGSEVKNTMSIGVAAEVGYTISPVMSAILMGGFQYHTNDAWGSEDTKTTFGIVAQLPYKIYGGFRLIPSIAYYTTDHGTSSPSQINIGGQIQYFF